MVLNRFRGIGRTWSSTSGLTKSRPKIFLSRSTSRSAPISLPESDTREGAAGLLTEFSTLTWANVVELVELRVSELEELRGFEP